MTDNSKNSRQSFLGPQAEREFAHQQIAIVGLCGGGSHIAQQLGHIGFSQFILCDYDHVEDSNLTRMIGSQPADAETMALKTGVIERMLNAINPGATVMSVPTRWQERAILLRNCSVVFGCVDSLMARDELERFCRRFLIPYIDIGMDVYSTTRGFSISGQVALSLPGCPCLRCMGILRDSDLAREAAKYGAGGGRPQVVWPNGVLASAAVGQFMSLILSWSKETYPELLLEYDGNRNVLVQSSKSAYFGEMKCPHHDQTGSLGDPFFAMPIASESSTEQLNVT